MVRPSVRHVVIVSAAATACVAVYALWWGASLDREEQHRARDETHIAVANLTADSLWLSRAGEHLADTVVIARGDIGELWAPPGRYFLSSRGKRSLLHYPLPLRGFGRGPDRDGVFSVTVRPEPEIYPPLPEGYYLPFEFIPSGTFLLGDRQNPLEAHYVWVTGFFIAAFEVTNREFRAFIDDPVGYADDANWTERGKHWKLKFKSQSTALMGPAQADYRRFGQPDQPVTWVNWFEANAFCRWLTVTQGGDSWLYALPTEAEWEKAARGPDGFEYALGMSISDAEVGLYNWKKNPIDSVTVVGIEQSRARYRPNRYGLYHMTGNVVEWTQSVNQPYSIRAPYANDARNADDTPGLRVARGGSWYSASTAILLISYRDAFQPEHSSQDIGFRVVARRLP